MTDQPPSPLDALVASPLFPITGNDLRVKEPLGRAESDRPRSGEPGGSPCTSCSDADDRYLWTNERWRVRAARRSSVKQVFLETRAHVDLSDMSASDAADLGPMLQRIERAMHATSDVGRVHIHRWGDGAAHFHLWLNGRPFGTSRCSASVSCCGRCCCRRCATTAGPQRWPRSRRTSRPRTPRVPRC